MSRADAFVPDTRSLTKLWNALGSCQGCELYQDATQAVFGSGTKYADLMLVGEQPGDLEDRRGRPFIGPAGQLLDRALAEAGIDRKHAYLTNAVKHFRWTPGDHGKRRLHRTPSAAHVTACRPWLAAELAAVRPKRVVALGAVAARSLLAPGFRLTEHLGQRAEWPPSSGPFAGNAVPVQFVLASYHPSAVLRAQDDERERMWRQLVSDLRQAAEADADEATTDLH